MRVPLACVWMLFCCGSLLAEESSESAREFAKQLYSVASTIEKQYVPPVSKRDLIAAALTKLYETGRTPVPASLPAEIKTEKPDELIELIAQARESVRDIPGMDADQVFIACCRSMTRLLDPSSGIVEPPRWHICRQRGPERFGLVLEVNKESDAFVIQSVAPGGPAQRAGVRPGDIISHVNGEPVVKTISTEIDALRVRGHNRIGRPCSGRCHGPRNLRVDLAASHNQGPWKLLLASECFRPETVLGTHRHDDNSWDYLLDRQCKVAYARITKFDNYTDSELRSILRAMKKNGSHGLVLDLRWCPGGLFNQTMAIAELFLDDSPVAGVWSRDRDGKGTQTEIMRTTCKQAEFRDLSLVVLVNGQTCRAAELLAAALQDNKRAVIVGQRTAGNAGVHNIIQVRSGAVDLKLMTACFTRPSGKKMHRFPDDTPADDWGVRPDAGREFPISPDLSKQLREWWTLQALRPRASRERLPLDDLVNDPQLQAAALALK